MWRKMSSPKRYFRQLTGPWLLTVLALTAMLGCKPGVPNTVIQPSDMEDILYDYHLADALFRMSGNGYSSSDIITFKAAILKKYGYTEAEYDSSMVYYMRHTERLHEIYEHLADRLSNEALAQGASVSNINKYGILSEKGDTANIWTAERALVLNRIAPFNLSTFTIPIDTTFHTGDRFMLECDAQFLWQEGSRDAVACLSIQFSNDSISTQVTHMTSTSHYSTQVSDSKHLGIKGLRGFFMVGSGTEADSKSTMHMVIVDNIRLVRMHDKQVPVPVGMEKDSVNLSADSLKLQRSLVQSN